MQVVHQKVFINRDHVTLRQESFNFYTILNHHKWFALTVFLLIVGVSMTVAMLQPKVYQTEADIYIDSKPKNLSGGLADSTFTTNASTPANQELNNQIEILKSHALIDEAVKKIQEKYGAQFPISREFFKEGLTPTVKNQTNVINLQLTASGKRELIPEVLKIYINEYQEYLRQMNSEKSAREKAFLEERLKESKDTLKHQGEQIGQFESETKMYNVDEQVRDMLARQSTLIDAYNGLNNDIAATTRETSLDKIHLKQSPEAVNLMSSLELDTEVGDLRHQMVALQTSKAELSSKLTNIHPKVEAINKQLDQVQSMLQARLKVLMPQAHGKNIATNIITVSPYDEKLAAEAIDDEIKLESMLARRKGLENNLNDVKQSLSNIPNERLKHTEIQSSFEMANEQTHDIQKKLDDAIMAEEVSSNFTRILVLNDPAIPQDPIKPDLNRIFIASILIGLCFGGISIFIRSATDQKLRWPFQVSGLLEEHTENIFMLPPIKNAASYAQLLDRTHPLLPTDFKPLLIHLENLNQNHNMRKIGILPVMPPVLEASLVTVEMASYLAELRNRLILLDMDSTEYSVTKQLLNLPISLSDDLAKGAGLIEFLNQDVEDFMDILYPLGQTVFASFVPNGKDQNTPFTFSRKKLEQVEANLSPNYDFVFYSLPCLMHSYDALSIIQRLDGVLLHVHPGITSMESLRYSLSEIQATHCKLLGVLFQAP